LEGHQDEVKCIGFSPDNTYLISGGCDNLVILWDLRKENPEIIHHYSGHSQSVVSVTFSFDPLNKILASGSLDNTIRI
jgi:katanin p80 WD40 repeat-containing subunit B1